MRILFFLVFLLLQAGWAQATVPNQSALKKAYPAAKAVSCKTCHTNAVGRGGDLNAYGLDLTKLPAPANPKAIKAEEYLPTGAADSDSDGVSNSEELNAGTNPGDKASMPQKTSWDFRWFESTAWAEEIRAKADYVGSETCAACHADITKQHQRSTHARVGADGPGGLDISCESCHGPGSLHANAGGGKGMGGLINPSRNPETCYACHTDKRMEFALQYHHPVPEGRMSCTDCHAPHGEKPTPRSARAQNETCLKCHEQLKGPWVFEHLAMRDGCLTCHQPHGSITTRLLAERDFNLCLKCHFSASQFQRIGHYAHRRATNVSGMEGANCTGCHRAVHGSNFSKELRTQ